jgi:DNA helicase II / ATP-dependent DNA helicase PcrA
MPLSYSQLQSYRMCPRRYEFAFIKKLPQKMTVASAFGVSVHSALAKWGKMEQDKGHGTRDMGNKQASLFGEEESSATNYKLQTTSLKEIWNDSFVHSVYENKASADFDRSRGEVLMREFYTWWKKEQRKVVAIEKGFRIQIEDERDERMRGGEEMTGRFDRVEELPDGTLRVIDYKTTMPRLQEEVDQDMQLSVYAMAAKEAFGKEASELIMLYMHEESITEVITTRSDSELKTAGKNIQLLAERIGSGDFAPTPSKDVCKCCPYRRVCDATAV